MTTAADVSLRFKARAVGLLYLLMILIGAIQMNVGRVSLSSNAADAAAGTLAHAFQIQFAFAADLLIVACYLPIPALLYQLLKPVNSAVSLTAAFFGLMGCAIQAFSSIFRIAPLVLLTGVEPASGIKRDQVEALAYLMRKLYTPAYRMGLVFFALAFILIGYLVFRSTFIPRVLGVLAMIAGFGWLTFLWPPLATLLWPRVILTLGIGEAALALWLLIKGVNVERWHERARAVQK
jgi:hypothetical protein